MSLASVLRQTAYVAAVTGIDAHGKAVYGPAVALAVRVEQSRSLVVNARGEEVASSHRLWCLSSINLTDRIWLPGASTSSSEAARSPIAVSSAGDFAGARTLYRVDL